MAGCGQGRRVTTIPARPLTPLDAQTYLAIFDHPTPADEQAMDAWVQATIAALGHDEILRFEQCAPGDLKGDLSVGQDSRGRAFDHQGRPMIDIWSERFYETFRALHADTLRPYARPYVAPKKVAGTWVSHDGQEHTGEWPVEYRVFARGGRVIGASAYYPQVPLGPEWLDGARAAIAQAQQICAWMDTHHLGVGNGSLCGDIGAAPDETRSAWIPQLWGPQDFTLDFLLTDDGIGPVFLEGGPGGWREAAPCCFESDAPGTLEGIKLALDGPTYPIQP